MSVHFLHGIISQESIVSIIGIIDKDEDIDIDLYFSSTGGDLNMAEVLIDFINDTTKNITLIGHWHIYSAALDVYLRSICRKRLLPDAHGMVHMADRDVSIRDMLDDKSQTAFLANDAKAYNNIWYEEHKSFFTKNERCILKKGLDVYLPHDRLVEFVDRFGLVLVEEVSSENV